MSKKKLNAKKYELTGQEKVIVELKSMVDSGVITGSDGDVAKSIISYYLARHEVSYKQVDLAKRLMLKVKPAAKVVTKKKYNLYAITDGTDVKLGLSTNIGKRIKTMQTSSSTSLVLLWKFYTGRDRAYAFKCEKKLHRLCKAHKVKGEWFKVECMELVKTFSAK